MTPKYAKTKRSRERNPGARIHEHKNQYQRHRESHLKRCRERVQTRRQKILTLLGPFCKQCGFSDTRALHIDHIFGGGRAHRRNRAPESLYNEMIESIQRDEGLFQILCANCNMIKKAEDHEYKPKSHHGIKSQPIPPLFEVLETVQ